MNGLMIDTPDSGIVTMEQAFAVQPKAKATRTYRPVPNKALWDMLSETANNRGLQLGVPQMGLSRKGQRLFGSVEITNQDHLDNEVRLMLGFRNSGDKSMSIGVCFGSKVFVCSNMVFTGYTSEEEEAIGQVRHRHSDNVFEGLQERLFEAMEKFEVFRSYQDDFYSRLKEIELTNAQAHDIIINAVRAEAITAKDCFPVAEYWAFQSHAPEIETENWHKEFMPRNAWSLFNCFTEIHKGIQTKNPIDANLRSIKMNKLFHQQFMMN